METEQALVGHRLAQRADEPVDGQRHRGRLLGLVGGRLTAVEVELTLGRARLRELQPDVAEQQRAQVVGGVGGVEEVGGETGVDRQVADVDAVVVEPAHGRLGAVHGDGPAVAAEQRPERVEHRRVVEERALRTNPTSLPGASTTNASPWSTPSSGTARASTSAPEFGQGERGCGLGRRSRRR